MGWVSYANEAKQQMLTCALKRWMAHGAVSDKPMREDGRGRAPAYGADRAIAVSGIYRAATAAATNQWAWCG